MGKWLVGALAVLFCSTVLAGEVAKVTAGAGADTAVKAKGGVNYEGLDVTPGQAAKLKAQGAHRWYDPFMTHSMHDLKKEIDILNLLNSLYLSEVQMRHIMVVAAKAEKARRAALKQAEAQTAKLEKALAAVRQEMVATGKSKCETNANKLAAEAQCDLGEINGGLNKQLVAYESYVKAILTDNQREKVYSYDHCLIPVKALRDPARIGSPDSGSVNEKLLESVRAMSAEDFDVKKDDLVSAAFAKQMYFMGGADITDEVRAKERDKMLTVFAKARGLNDLDFQFTKAKLAAQLNTDYLEIKDRVKEISKQVLKVQNEKKFDGKASPGVYTQMFLDSRIIPLLAERLRISEGFKGEEAVDLDKIEKAAACGNGSCAID